jgi:hypothetical protein
MPRRFLSFEAPFPIVAEHLAKDEDFQSDAKRIVVIDDDRIAALAEALVEERSFLDRPGLSAIVDQCLGPGEDAANVSRILWRLSQVLRGADEPLAEAVRVLKESISKFSTAIAENDRTKFGERVERLVALPAAFTRQYKAEKLAEATGAQLEDIQIICDIRPVFNEDRSVIEGAVPVTTLRLDFVELDGTTSSVEVRLTERQVSDLCDKAESARKKVSVIKSILHEKSITMPFTRATIGERAAK